MKDAVLPSKMCCYLAPASLIEQVKGEVGTPIEIRDRLIIAGGAPRATVWAQNVWLDPRVIHYTSISDAARKLKDIQRNWRLFSTGMHRRAALIEEQLPAVSSKPIAFPSALPNAPLGSWTVLDRERILASPNCSSPFGNGEIHFQEKKSGPPSRAYLKLWEVFLRFQSMPAAGERCLDMGASPGGWSWVLSKLSAQVTAIDRSPLEGEVASSPAVEFRRGDGFQLLPGRGDEFDWIFCDAACYPEKLLQWVTTWIKHAPAARFVCTLKFQGKEGYGAVQKFAAIRGGKLLHLFHNKHELTWVKL